MEKTLITIGVAYDQLLEDLRAVVRHELHHAPPTTPAPEKREELLSVREAAVLLQVTVQSIHEWKRRGLLPYYKLGSRSYLKRADVLAALEEHQRTIKARKGVGRG